MPQFNFRSKGDELVEASELGQGYLPPSMFQQSQSAGYVSMHFTLTLSCVYKETEFAKHLLMTMGMQPVCMLQTSLAGFNLSRMVKQS